METYTFPDGIYQDEDGCTFEVHNGFATWQLVAGQWRMTDVFGACRHWKRVDLRPSEMFYGKTIFWSDINKVYTFQWDGKWVETSSLADAKTAIETGVIKSP